MLRFPRPSAGLALVLALSAASAGTGGHAAHPPAAKAKDHGHGHDAHPAKPAHPAPAAAPHAPAAPSKPSIRYTEVCGTLRAAEWVAAKSPYLVTSDLYLPNTSRIKIGPGVTVRFARKPKPCNAEDPAPPPLDWADSAYVGFRVEGQFQALGTAEAPIVFEPEDAKPASVGWDGLRIKGVKARDIQIGFAVFRGANQALQVKQSTFFVHHCLFEGNNTGIALLNRGDIAVTHSNFLGNRSAGITIDKARPRIAASIFAGNRGYGIWNDGRLGMSATYNAFSGNREADCYRCPHSIRPAGLADTAADVHGNLGADPLFEGSESHKAALLADEATDTPDHLVKDKELAKMEAANREKWAKEKAGFKPMGSGPHRLSAYSRLTDAGPPGDGFKDRDGSRGDIGLHGGPMEPLSDDPF